MEELAAALRSADWPRALAHALDAWREHRSAELATLIDAIATKLPAVPSPKPEQLHEWWMQRADPYDALGVGALVECASTRLGMSDREKPPTIARGLVGAREVSAALALITAASAKIDHANAFDRLGAILAWPDDPRAATILVEWLVTTPVRWDTLVYGHATHHFYGAIADKLKLLADRRGLPRLVECEQAPRGPTAAIRRQQRILARQAREAIEKRPVSKRIAKQVAACASSIPTREAFPTRDHTVAEDVLWAECARLRGDRAPRLVLADALAERGDPRGELIALQCTGTSRSAAQAKKLLRLHWNTWLGDLGLLLNRSGTEFVDGMLDVARVGTPKTPEWVFAKVHGHRELATVRVVRPGHIRPKLYATVLASPNLRPDRIAIDAPEVIDHMRAIRTRWRFRALEYGHYAIRDAYRYEFPPLADTFAAIAELVPELEEIRIDALQWPQDARVQLHAIVPKLPRMFGALKAITLDAAWLGDAELRAMPLVTMAS